MWTAMLGTEVISLESMTPTDKLTLRSQHRTDPYECRGCGGRVHTRLNPIDDDTDAQDPFLTFAHHPYEAEKCRALGLSWDESPEHHQLKARLARAARHAGWTTELEVQPNAICRADVVATSRTGNQWALEAQLATLHLDKAIERHDRYTTEFGACTWVHTRNREWANRIPSLRVEADDHSTVIGGVKVDQIGTIDAPPSPLDKVIPSILAKRITYVYLEDFGYYVDLTRPVDPRRVRPERPASPRGSHVAESCERVPTPAWARRMATAAEPEQDAPDAHCSFTAGNLYCSADPCPNPRHRPPPPGYRPNQRGV